jgi:hypothetical protein
MVSKDVEVSDILEKVNNVTEESSLDLSSGEDLSIGIMNLISIEEHLFFTANKTNKDNYYHLLNEIREIRKTLLKELIKDYEGEEWCISKHLLAASMRVMEVGTKALTNGEDDKAKKLFEHSYRLYMMFWEINLKLADKPTTAVKKAEPNNGQPKPNSDDIILFYDIACEHCKDLELFLTKHNLYTIFNIKKHEVSSNEKNHKDMEGLYKEYIDPKRELEVPLVSYNNKVYMGEEEVIKMLKNRIWQTVNEKEQTLKSLLKKTNLPSHIKTHHEQYSHILETALNCCKE